MHQAPSNKVSVLAYDGLCTFEFGIAAEVFGLERPEIVGPWYDFSVVGAEPGPLKTTGGMSVAADNGLEQLASAGTIVVPGWRDLDEPPPESVLRALRDAHERGARLISICSGAFLLAATGLLDGLRATTHWRYAEQLTQMYPAVTVDPDVLYIDEGSVLTSAGSASGIDACIHVVREDYGPGVAAQVARRLVVSPHRDGGQAQFIPAAVPKSSVDGLASVMSWAAENLSRPLTVEVLAEQAMMSPRSLSRHFVEQVGTSPHRWITQQRLHLAQTLLESSDMSMDEIGSAAGFGTAATLRHHFTKAYTTTPSAFRRRFADTAVTEMDHQIYRSP